MRDGWRLAKLEEVCVLITDGSHFSPVTLNEGRPYVTVRDLVDGHIDFDNCASISEVAFVELCRNGCSPRQGDVLFSKDGTVGKVCLVSGGPEFVVLSSLAILRPETSIVNPIFLSMTLQSDAFQEIATGSKTGLAIKRVVLKNLRRLNVPIAPLLEQLRIVDLITSVDSYIYSLQLQAANARTARNAVLQELLSTDGDGWTETTLGKIAKWGSGGTPSAGTPEYYGGNIPWCVIGDLTEGEVFKTANSLTNEGLQNSSAKLVNPGSVLLAMYGASIGRTGISVIPMTTNQAIAFATVDEKCISNSFLLKFLQQQKKQFVAAGQGAAQPNISQAVIKSWPIHLPPLVEQRRIVDLISSMDDVIQATERVVEDAKSLRSGLLSDLLSGAHEIPASYDRLVGAA